jgi:hypothetical protein
MSVDIEAGGAAVTAGLAAKAIEGQGGSGDKGRSGTCANCGAALVGAYCHACGQTAHVHRSLWHMLEESLHGVLHFDSKSWRTLPLLIGRPGLLTRRYIDGQRVRYVSPLALFLFMVFLMFFVVSSITSSGTNSDEASPAERADAREQLVAVLDGARKKVAESTASLSNAADDAERIEAEQELEAARTEERTAAAVLSVFDKASSTSPAEATLITGEELKALTGWDFGTKASTVIEGFKENPELQLYKLKNTAYKFAFMLIPISLPFLWLMFFWKPNVTAYDHIVFSLYSLSFMSLLFIVMGLMSTTEFTNRFAGYLLLAPPLHMYVHLRGTYALSRFSALWRTFALLVSAGAVFILFLVLIATISYA